MEVVIRGATAADLEALARLLALLFALEPDFRPDPARQRRGLERLLAEPGGRAVLVAERAGAVIGMVTGQEVCSTAEGGPAIWVEDLVVDPGARRGGVGARLLAAIEAWGRGRGATRLQLVADRENDAALAFYARLGWRRTRLVCLHRRPAPPTAPAT